MQRFENSLALEQAQPINQCYLTKFSSIYTIHTTDCVLYLRERRLFIADSICEWNEEITTLSYQNMYVPTNNVAGFYSNIFLLADLEGMFIDYIYCLKWLTFSFEKMIILISCCLESRASLWIISSAFSFILKWIYYYLDVAPDFYVL